MRAAVFHGAGDIRIEAVAAPGEPGPGEVLIAPSMAAICGTDASEYAHGPHMIPLHQPHPAEPGQHDRGALFLGDLRDREGDRGVGDHAGDEQSLTGQ